MNTEIIRCSCCNKKVENYIIGDDGNYYGSICWAKGNAPKNVKKIDLYTFVCKCNGDRIILQAVDNRQALKLSYKALNAIPKTKTKPATTFIGTKLERKIENIIVELIG